MEEYRVDLTGLEKRQEKVKQQLAGKFRTFNQKQADNARRAFAPKSPTEIKAAVVKKKKLIRVNNRSISVMRRKIAVMDEIIGEQAIGMTYDPAKSVPLFLPVWGAEALEMYILGESVQMISKRQFKTEATVKDLIASPEGKNYLQKACKLIDIQKVRDEYRGMWFECLQLLQDVVRSNDPDYKQTKVQLAKWFVEVSGVKVPEEVKHKHEHILRGVAGMIANRAKTISSEPPQDVIDGEFEVMKGEGNA